MEKHKTSRNQPLTNFLMLLVGNLFMMPALAANLPKNQKPIANAGPDQLAGLGQIVALSGERSFDADGNVVAYHWKQTKGPKLAITGADTASPSFITPETLKQSKQPKPLQLEFNLTVTDDRKAKASDKITIIVSEQPCPPPQMLLHGVCPVKLNDTGITNCSDAGQNNLTCPLDALPNQDAENGRDFTHNDDSDGHTGFSFTKLDNNGQPLANNASEWVCVKDNITGLIWEVKTDDGGLRDKDWTYSWYEPNKRKNGGKAGYRNLGDCNGSACDTDSYVKAVNTQTLCGASDWRMPSQQELQSIVDYSVIYPSIDSKFFPNSQGDNHWTSSPYASNSNGAWSVWFYVEGQYPSYFNAKSDKNRVRLVRNGQ